MESLVHNSVSHDASSGTEQLARFFPGVARVQVHAILKPRNSRAGSVQESVLLEFGSPENAIFSSRLPLEFDDLVQLQPGKGKGRSDARVIAVQYHEGRKVVAVQFANAQGSWVKRP